ncbi:hypothetical protein BSLG_003608 [Batrachochytrium salamandrivorans]|nr:hypothetical protein BSLG_003608 [Batrachochytrium salamandrivorans]
MSAALPTSPFEVSSLLHSGYHHPTLRTWQASAGGLSHITKSSLVFPIFIHDLPDVKEPIATLPGQFRFGINTLKESFEPLVKKGLATVLLFGVPTSIEKDARGSAADDENGPVIRLSVYSGKSSRRSWLHATYVCVHILVTVIAVSSMPMALLTTILALIVLQRLRSIMLKQVISPSDMMDGRIRAIKHALLKNRLGSSVSVMSYSAKFASVFYGPFRDAACSAPSAGDRKSYQLPPGARGLARRALELVPDLLLAIYQVSGEYDAVAFFQHKVFDLRAGANILITYYTPLILDWLSE